MIKYTVRCGNDHEFEGWYKDSGAFDKLARRGHVECPVCGDTKTVKAPMAPRIGKSSMTPDRAEARAKEVAQRVLEAAVQIRESVEANCDYVGTQFAEEARRIHYGEADDRGIYGEATIDDTRELEDEGIAVLPLPPVRRTKRN